MRKYDFDRIKEIAKELNDIRLRNDLQELQMLAKDNSFTYYEHHKEWNEVMLLTRGEHYLKDCRIVSMKQDKNTNEFADMDYDKYMSSSK